jgi:hypothetical protein
MPTDTHEIAEFLSRLLQENSIRKGDITALEKLVTVIISQKMTYQQASVKYQYTESSFQNAASRLFKDLSLIVKTPVNRKNIFDLIEREKELALKTVNSKIVLEHISADFWVRSERAQLVSISYRANKSIDLTDYLVKYSPNFQTTFCADIKSNSSPLTTLLYLCDCLQITIPSFNNDIRILLGVIKRALQKRSILLVLRFDQTTEIIQQWGDYIDILVTLGNVGNGTCLLVLHKDLECNALGVKQSLYSQVSLAINEAIEIRKEKSTANDTLSKPRLISIDDNQQIICNLMQTYLK